MWRDMARPDPMRLTGRQPGDPEAMPKALAGLAATLAVAGTFVLLAVPESGRPGSKRAEPSARQCSSTPPNRRSASVKRPRRLWTGDMEEGTLEDWEASKRGAGGGEFDSGSGKASASREAVRSGKWAAKLTLPEGRGGTRLFRWRELRRHRHAVVSVWLKIPRRYQLTADGSTGRYWNVFQFKSRSTSGDNDPLWYLNMANRRRGRLGLELIWWHRTLEGPRRGQSGFRRFRQSVAHVPVGRWFKLTAQLRQSSDFDGLLCVWQDGRRLFAKPGIRTSFTNDRFNAWHAANEWSVNNYSDGLVPRPSVLFADDASISAW
jgi:hypothetical protein